jgi:hypothetical protein
MEREDGLAQFGDGCVEQVNGRFDAYLGGGVDDLTGGLQLQAGGEQPVDHGVVQALGDALPVMGHSVRTRLATHHLLKFAGVELQGVGRARGWRTCKHFVVAHVELLVLVESATKGLEQRN